MVVEHEPGVGRVGRWAGWGAPTCWALAWAETRLVLRHPVTALFVALGTFFALMLHLDVNTQTFVWYRILTGLPVFVFATGVPIVGVLVASRSRHDGTDELYDSMPATRDQRSGAQIAAFGSLAALTAVAVAAVWVGTRAWSGLPIALEPNPGARSVEYPLGFEFPATDVAPSLVELAQGPAAVLVAGVLGLLLGRWIPTRWLIVVMIPAVLAQVVLVSWASLDPDARWFLPFADASQHVGSVTVGDDGSTIPVVQGFDTTALGWHFVYLIGLTSAMAAALVGSVRRDWAVRIACLAGLAVAATGGVLQITTAVGNLP
ncbi:MAG TPA: hypothetical protein VMN58_02925 [Acidimicrobiales bacterium]|nr:hypothetical protein [Acidimicrobiales bacterium]